MLPPTNGFPRRDRPTSSDHGDDSSSNEPFASSAQHQQPPHSHEETQRRLLESIGIPAFCLGRHGTIVEWNTALAQATRRAAEEMCNAPPPTWSDATDQAQWDAAVRHCWTGNNAKCHIRYGARIRDRGAFDVGRCSIWMTPQSWDGQVVGVCCFVDFERTTESIPTVPVDDRELMGAAVKDANVGLCAVGSDGHIDLWNTYLSDVSCYSKEDAIGRMPCDIFQSATEGPSLDTLLESAVKDGLATETMEVQVQRKCGGHLRLLVTVSPRRTGSIITGATVVGLPLEKEPSSTGLTGESSSSRDERELTSSGGQANGKMATDGDPHLEDYDLLPSPVFGTDNSGRINLWNIKAGKFFGLSFHQAKGMSLEDLTCPVSHEAITHMRDSVRKGGEDTSIELVVLDEHYEARYLRINACARRDKDGVSIGQLFVGHDSTEARQHDHAIVAMARELRQLIDLANVSIFGIDEEGLVNEWNDKTAEITGYAKEEATGSNLTSSFIVPHMRAGVEKVLTDALRGKGTSNFDLEFRTKSGETRHLLVNATTRRDASNGVVGVVCVAQDVTESVQRDTAVAGMALELRQLIDCANAPIFGIDIDGNVNEWNRCLERITGYSKQEAFDEPLVERFIAPTVQATVREILSKALTGIETSNYELEVLTKHGESRFLIINATTRRDPYHHIVGVVGVGQDITDDRKHAEELQKLLVLQATQEAKVEVERSMTAYFAHELRNPLSAIDSALNAMPDNLPPSVSILVSGMRLCSSFMSSIMNNLLDVRKMEEGKMVLNTVPICLQSLVDGVFSMLAPSVKPGVRFRKVVKVEDRNWVLGDEHRIQQIFTNVVTNAIKYTNTGSISLELCWNGDNVQFLCVDTGPGIPINEQSKLFQRYVQRGGAPGSGLGLAIAKHLVDLCHGSIYFDSDPSIKAGTSCIVSLPLPVCNPPDHPEVQGIAMIEEPLRFLIVDDVKLNRMMLERRIQKGIAPNCSIAEASTGEEALKVCASCEFDVIIVDQYMEKAGGVMVGTDVVYALRRMRSSAIIIGCSGNDLEREFRDAGADFIWQKPMPSNSQIVAHLRLAMASKRDISTA